MNFALIFYGIALASMVLNIADGAKTDYCSAKLCRGLKHIGCNNKGVSQNNIIEIAYKKGP